MQIPSVTLVIGGAASGKSAWAETFVQGTDLAKVYIATAEAFDAEMDVKIAKHKEARIGKGWRTVEAPRRLPEALAGVDAEEIALIDCATLWLANAKGEPRSWRKALTEVLDALDQCPAPLVIVTNELGHGLVPADPKTRAFRDDHGFMNQELAKAADLVVSVTAGLPMVLKGKMPW